MRLHELLKAVAGVMMPDRAGELYDYFLHTFDDNAGFLRTRHQWWDEPVCDRRVPDVKIVLITIQGSQFDQDCKLLLGDRTLLTVELYCIVDEGYLDEIIETARQVYFTYTCIVDLVSKTYVLGGKSYQEYADEGVWF